MQLLGSLNSFRITHSCTHTSDVKRSCISLRYVYFYMERRSRTWLFPESGPKKIFRVKGSTQTLTPHLRSIVPNVQRHCYSRCGRLSSYSLSKGRLLYSFIFVHISYIFIFRSHFYFRRVVRNDSLVRRLRRQRSKAMCRWTLGTIQRRCGVTVLVKPLPESPFSARIPGSRF